MPKKNPLIDNYLKDGCGRCPLGGTPECKVNPWRPILTKLRKALLDCGLTEELKWKVPCYTFDAKNIVILSAFKEYCSISFFKGSLLKDTHNILVAPGENSQATRQMRVTTAKEVAEILSILPAYIQEAIDLERADRKVDFSAKNKLAYPEELQKRFDELPKLKEAFEKLTPGRQRGYLLHFTAAKQSTTRESRIDKCVDRILLGKGIMD